jgi:hypothetical protein
MLTNPEWVAVQDIAPLLQKMLDEAYKHPTIATAFPEAIGRRADCQERVGCEFALSAQWQLGNDADTAA